MPTNANVLAILDWILRRIARRFANEAAAGCDADLSRDVLAQIQAQGAPTAPR